MIDETLQAPSRLAEQRDAPRRPTRAEQRAATRQALIDATATCLVEDGYAALTTRHVAERAGVAQSTLMHYFETREALLIEAVEQRRAAARSTRRSTRSTSPRCAPPETTARRCSIRRGASSPRRRRSRRRSCGSPRGSEPELASTLRDLEHRLDSIIAATAATLFPEHAEDPRFPALIATAVSLIRGS